MSKAVILNAIMSHIIDINLAENDKRVYIVYDPLNLFINTMDKVLITKCAEMASIEELTIVLEELKSYAKS